MKKWIEAIVFTGLAMAVLVAGFSVAETEGADAGGEGGDALISISAAPTLVAELVEDWERPVDVTPEPLREIDPVDTAQPELPQAPQFELAQAPEFENQIRLFQPQAQQELVIDTAAPPPLPEPEPEPEPEVKPQPKPKPVQPRPEPVTPNAQQDSAGRAQQRAAGSGGRQQAGTSGSAEVATANKGQQQKLMQIWGAKVRNSVARRKRSPRGQSGKGTVIVRLNVSSGGQLLSHRILRSSGNSAYDQAALQAVTSVRRFPKAPKQFQANSSQFDLPLTFQ